MIPDAAVEAAWDKLHENPIRPIGIDWAEMAAAIEAAAPHMMARVSTLDELALMEPGTVIQGPDFHGETYKCTGPGTFHAIASPTEYRPSELVGRGPFTIIHKGDNQVIPDEAVEAAARALAFTDGDVTDARAYRAQARIILEAAAPHLMAGNKAAEDRLLAMAWIAGVESVRANPTGRLVNPYKQEQA